MARRRIAPLLVASLAASAVVVGRNNASATPLEEEFISKPGWCPGLAGPTIQNEHSQWHMMGFGALQGRHFVEFHREYLAQSDDFRLYGADAPPGDVDPDPAIIPVVSQAGSLLKYAHTSLNGFARPALQDIGLPPGNPSVWPTRPAQLTFGNVAFYAFTASQVGSTLDGLFHGNGHIAIASHDRFGMGPLGDMGSTVTATRDGAFYQWHKNIDNIYADWAVAKYRQNAQNVGLPIFFSVGSTAVGAAGSSIAERRQANVYDTAVPSFGAIPRIASDIYVGDQNNLNLVYRAGVRQWATLNAWDVDAFTILNPAGNGWYFSVTMNSAGAAGTAVAAQAVKGGHLFSSGGGGANALFRSAAQLGLVNAASDNLDAVEVDEQRQVQGTNDGNNVAIFTRGKQWFSLRAGSTFGVQALGGAAVLPSDILNINDNGDLVVAVPGATMGLGAADELDALVIVDVNANNVLDGPDNIFYSLAAGSPALGPNSPADIFCHTVAGAVCGALGGRLHVMAGTLGLLASDDLDALDVRLATASTGACCTIDQCLHTTAAECTSMNGTFSGLGTQCDGVYCPTPPGACCLPTGCSTLSDVACNAAGGSFKGTGVSCTQVACPLPPPHDRCEEAYPVPYTVPQPGHPDTYYPPADNSYAYPAPADPAYSCHDHNVFFPPYGSGTLWYRYDVPPTGPRPRLTYTTRETQQYYGQTAAGDTRIAIYYAPQGNCQQLQEVACGDNTYDATGNYNPYADVGYQPTQPGTYYVQVSTVGDAARGQIRLAVTAQASSPVPGTPRWMLPVFFGALTGAAGLALRRRRRAVRLG